MKSIVLVTLVAMAAGQNFVPGLFRSPNFGHPMFPQRPLMNSNWNVGTGMTGHAPIAQQPYPMNFPFAQYPFQVVPQHQQPQVQVPQPQQPQVQVPQPQQVQVPQQPIEQEQTE